MVKLRYHGHSITVPVIDRGPYVAGRDYDLTEATKDASASRASARAGQPLGRSVARSARRTPMPSWSCAVGGSGSASAAARPRSRRRRGGRRAGAPAAAGRRPAAGRGRSAQTTSGSLVGSSTDWERVTLVQSSRRILIPIERPSSSLLRRRRQSSSVSSRRCLSSSPRSPTSTSKVISIDCDLVSRETTDRRLVPSRAAGVEPGARARPEARFELAAVALAAARRACGSRASPAVRPFSGRSPGRARADSAPKRSSASSRESDDQSRRLAELAGDLGQHPALGDPDRAGQPGVGSRISAVIRRIVAFGEKIPVRSR